MGVQLRARMAPWSLALVAASKAQGRRQTGRGLAAYDLKSGRRCRQARADTQRSWPLSRPWCSLCRRARWRCRHRRRASSTPSSRRASTGRQRWSSPRRPAVRHAAGRERSRHQERPAPADAVRDADRRLVGRARAARHRVRPQLRHQPLRLRLLHGADAAARTTASAASPPNGDVAAAGSEVVLLDLRPLSRRHQPQRRRHALRPRRQALRRASARTPNGAELADARRTASARCCASTPTARSRPTTRSTPQTTGDNRAIWALGLRNPFTFAFQPGTGRMFINDVGQNTWEEIDDGIAGANYGWPITEGATDGPALPQPAVRLPHGPNDTPACAITGGTFYNPPTSSFPAELRRRLLLRRLLQRLDQRVRPGGRRGRRDCSDLRDGHRHIPSTCRSARTGACTTSRAS